MRRSVGAKRLGSEIMPLMPQRPLSVAFPVLWALSAFLPPRRPTPGGITHNGLCRSLTDQMLDGNHRSLPRAREAKMPPKDMMAKMMKATWTLFRNSGNWVGKIWTRPR